MFSGTLCGIFATPPHLHVALDSDESGLYDLPAESLKREDDMELLRVEEIALSETSNALLADIDETARRVNEFRRLPPETVRTLLHDLLGERVYTSNAIEGNTLDLRETREVLRTGHVDIPKRREATEALNLGEAIKQAQVLTEPDARIDVEQFLLVHQILLKGIDDEWAGRFRDRSVVIHAAKYQPPDSTYVPDMVDRFFEGLDSAADVHPVLLATWAHWTIARIHPFFDGNGRMARLWQDIILFRSQLTCAIVRPEDRRDYLSALESADEGRFDPFLQLVARRLAATLDKYLDAQSKSEELDEWASALGGEVDARATEQRRLSYVRWSRKMEQIRFEFEQCAVRITQAANDIDIQLRAYDMIDQAKWESIRFGGKVAETWLFHLGFRRGRQYMRYIFFFGRHYWSDTDSDAERGEPRVSLLVSEQAPGAERARRLGEEDFITPLSLREVFVVDNHVVRKRYDPATETDVYDRDIEPMIVAQDFIQEVLLGRLT